MPILTPWERWERCDGALAHNTDVLYSISKPTPRRPCTYHPAMFSVPLDLRLHCCAAFGHGFESTLLLYVSGTSPYEILRLRAGLAGGKSRVRTVSTHHLNPRLVTVIQGQTLERLRISGPAIQLSLGTEAWERKLAQMSITLSAFTTRLGDTQRLFMSARRV